MFRPTKDEYSATFLTGVGLEQRKRRPKRKPRLALEEPEAPEYVDILRNALTMEKPTASIDDLRTMIQRTRKKLDRQRSVLDGFRTDVRQLKGSSFGSSEPDASSAALKNKLSSSTPSLRRSSFGSLESGASSAALNNQLSSTTPSLPNASSVPCVGNDYGISIGEGRLQRSQSAGTIRSSPGMVSRRTVQRSDSHADLTHGVHKLLRGSTPTIRPSSSGGLSNGPRRPPDFTLQKEQSLRPASRGGSRSGSCSQLSVDP